MFPQELAHRGMYIHTTELGCHWGHLYYTCLRILSGFSLANYTQDFLVSELFLHSHLHHVLPPFFLLKFSALCFITAGSWMSHALGNEVPQGSAILTRTVVLHGKQKKRKGHHCVPLNPSHRGDDDQKTDNIPEFHSFPNQPAPVSSNQPHPVATPLLKCIQGCLSSGEHIQTYRRQVAFWDETSQV